MIPYITAMLLLLAAFYIQVKVRKVYLIAFIVNLPFMLLISVDQIPGNQTVVRSVFFILYGFALIYLNLRQFNKER